MHLHVLGAGAIGCLFAHHAARAGWPVTLLLRPGAARAFDAAGRRVRVDGQSVECNAEAVGGEGAAAALPSPSVTGGGGGGDGHASGPLIQNLLVATQAPQTAAALAAVAHRLGRGSVVVLLQNGVLAVHEELVKNGIGGGGCGSSSSSSSEPLYASSPLAAVATAALREGAQGERGGGKMAAPRPRPRPQFLLGSTTHGATRRAPFDVVWHKGLTVFGRPLAGSSSGGGGGGREGSGAEDRTAEVLAALGSPALAPLRVDASLSARDLHAQLLRKLLVNAAANPLAALLRCRNGGLLASESARALIAAAVAECRAALGPLDAAAGAAGAAAAAGAADGADAGLEGTQGELVAAVEGVLRATAGNVNSMLASVLRGGATEADYINGYVAARAAARGVPAPLNEAYVKLLRAVAEVPADLREGGMRGAG